MEICTQMLGRVKLCFRNHSDDIIDFYFDFNERRHKLRNDFCVFGVFTTGNYGTLTIIPTEFLLHKHFTKQGVKK